MMYKSEDLEISGKTANMRIYSDDPTQKFDKKSRQFISLTPEMLRVKVNTGAEINGNLQRISFDNVYPFYISPIERFLTTSNRWGVSTCGASFLLDKEEDAKALQEFFIDWATKLDDEGLSAIEDSVRSILGELAD